METEIVSSITFILMHVKTFFMTLIYSNPLLVFRAYFQYIDRFQKTKPVL